MTVESLDTRQNLAVVSARDQDLCARPDGSLEDGEGAGCELMFFDLSNFVLAKQQCQRTKKLNMQGDTYVSSERGLDRSSLRNVSSYSGECSGSDTY
jgi:hypothetical protein